MAWLVPVVARLRTTRDTHLDREESAQVVRSSALSLVGAITTALVGVGLVVLLARVAEPAILGWFSISQSWFLVAVAVAGLGTKTGLVYVVSRLRIAGQLQSFGTVLRYALVPVLVGGILVTLVLLRVSGPVSEAAGAIPGARESLIVMAVFVPITGLMEGLDAATLGLGYVRPTVFIERILRPILQVTLVMWALWAGITAWLNVAWAAAALPLLALAIWQIIRLWPSSAPAESDAVDTELTTFWGFWRYTGPRALTTLLQVALQRVDIIVVGVMAGPAEAAVYVAATRFLVLAQVGNQALSTVLQPRLSDALGRGDRNRAAALYQLSSAWLVLLTWPILLSALFFAEPLMSIFGPSYEGGTVIIQILAVVMLAATLAGLTDVTLLMSGHSLPGLLNHALSLAVMIGVDLALIPGYGVVGAALGWAASIMVKNGLAVWQVWRWEGILPFAPRSWKAVGVTVLSFGVVPAVAVLALGPAWAAVAVSLPIATLLYLGLVIALRAGLGITGFRSSEGKEVKR